MAAARADCHRRRARRPGRGTDVNADGTLDWIPEIPRYIIDRRETTRQAFNAVVQWKPSENFSMYLDGTYAKGREEVSSMLMQLGGAAGLIDYANSSVGADNTVDHIELTSSAAFPIDLAYRNINGQLEARAIQRDAGRGMGHARSGSSTAA